MHPIKHSGAPDSSSNNWGRRRHASIKEYQFFKRVYERENNCRIHRVSTHYSGKVLVRVIHSQSLLFPPTTELAPADTMCYRCMGTGHYSYQCWKTNAIQKKIYHKTVNNKWEEYKHNRSHDEFSDNLIVSALTGVPLKSYGPHCAKGTAMMFSRDLSGGGKLLRPGQFSPMSQYEDSPSAHVKSIIMWYILYCPTIRHSGMDRFRRRFKSDILRIEEFFKSLDPTTAACAFVWHFLHMVYGGHGGLGGSKSSYEDLFRIFGEPPSFYGGPVPETHQGIDSNYYYNFGTSGHSLAVILCTILPYDTISGTGYLGYLQRYLRGTWAGSAPPEYHAIVKYHEFSFEYAYGGLCNADGFPLEASQRQYASHFSMTVYSTRPWQIIIPNLSGRSREYNLPPVACNQRHIFRLPDHYLDMTSRLPTTTPDREPLIRVYSHHHSPSQFMLQRYIYITGSQHCNNYRYLDGPGFSGRVKGRIKCETCKTPVQVVTTVWNKTYSPGSLTATHLLQPGVVDYEATFSGHLNHKVMLDKMYFFPVSQYAAPNLFEYISNSRFQNGPILSDNYSFCHTCSRHFAHYDVVHARSVNTYSHSGHLIQYLTSGAFGIHSPVRSNNWQGHIARSKIRYQLVSHKGAGPFPWPPKRDIRSHIGPCDSWASILPRIASVFTRCESPEFRITLSLCKQSLNSYPSR